MNNKFYHVMLPNGRRLGPYSEQDLRAQVARDELPSTAHIWTEGMTDWEPIDRHFPHSQPPATIPDEIKEKKKENLAKLGCCIPIAILLGGIIFNAIENGGSLHWKVIPVFIVVIYAIYKVVTRGDD